MNLFGHVGLTLAAAYTVDRLVRPRLARRLFAERSAPHMASVAPPADLARAGDSAQHRLDYRMVMVGSLVSDFIDKPLGLWLAPELVNHDHRSFAHSVLWALVFLAICSLASPSRLRTRLMTLALSGAGHLVLDQMWRQPTIALWPGLGWAFPERAATLAGLSSSLFRGVLLFYRDPPELAGAIVIGLFAILLWRRRSFLRFLRAGSVA